MANAFYTKFVESYMTQAANQVDLDADDIRVILIDVADYTVNIATDEFLSIIPGAARVSTSSSLTGKTVTARVFDADDTVFTSVTGDQCEALVVYKHTGVEATSRLIAYLDTGITGMPITPSGSNINLTWDNGANKIGKL